MTWGQLKQEMEKAGVKDGEIVEFFDREVFNELVQLYRALDSASPRKKGEVLAHAVEWVDALRDRYVTAGERGWHDGIGFPFSHDDGRVVAIRDDGDPNITWGSGDGIVKVYFSSVMVFERPERYLDAAL